jgi:hypothetical protein
MPSVGWAIWQPHFALVLIFAAHQAFHKNQAHIDAFKRQALHHAKEADEVQFALETILPMIDLAATFVTVK